MTFNSINIKLLKTGTDPQNSRNVTPGQHSGLMWEAIERWLMTCRAEDLSEETVKLYETSLVKFYWWCTQHSHLIDRIGSDPNAFTIDHAVAFVAYLKEKQSFRWGEPVHPGKEKLSISTVATYTRSVRVFFNWLEERREIDASPFNRGVRVYGKRDRVLTNHHKNLQEEQLGKIFEYLMQPKYKNKYTGVRNLAIISLFLDSGMRLGELISIKKDDVLWSRKMITVLGKTGERTCFFSPATEQALQSYWIGFRSEQKDFLAPHSPFWLTSDGHPLTKPAVRAFIAAMSKSCEFTFSAHRFRHTFASLMVKQVGLYELKELLGHSNVSTTLIYTHGSPDSLKASYRGRSPLATLDVGLPQKKKRRGRKPGKEEGV